MSEKIPENIDRREILKKALWGVSVAGLGGITGFVLPRTIKSKTAWQIDPFKCVSCSRCETECVLMHSAVRCVHIPAMCGHRETCPAFFDIDPLGPDTASRTQLCPQRAIRRSPVSDPYYSYTIDTGRCSGCAKCVERCGEFGNGSLFLQIHHNLCINCNECKIAAACPATAIKKVPADEPYIFKNDS